MIERLLKQVAGKANVIAWVIFVGWCLIECCLKIAVLRVRRGLTWTG